MCRFLDGPAAGVTLLLRRAPLFLRAVNNRGDWDALDQLNDTPAAHEAIVAYRRVAAPAIAHINRGGHGSGWYALADYRVVVDQPAEAELRDTAKWRAWTEAHRG